MAAKKIKGVKLSKHVSDHMPYICFLAVLAMLYIANAHRGEKAMRDLQVLEKEAKETHWRYMSAQSDLLQRSSRTQVEGKVANDGLVMPVESPKKLKVKD